MVWFFKKLNYTECSHLPGLLFNQVLLKQHDFSLSCTYTLYGHRREVKLGKRPKEKSRGNEVQIEIQESEFKKLRLASTMKVVHWLYYLGNPRQQGLDRYKVITYVLSTFSPNPALQRTQLPTSHSCLFIYYTLLHHHHSFKCINHMNKYISIKLKSTCIYNTLRQAL